LSTLLAEHGYSTFKEARHPLGLTQRQANGKFTVAEATDLIDRLTQSASAAGSVSAEDATSSLEGSALPLAQVRQIDHAAVKALRRTEELIAAVSDEMLADELQRRGWCCIAPPTDS
jgi:hypothetical protein